MTNSNRARGHLDEQLLAKLSGIRELSLHRATNLREHAKPTTKSELLWMSLALQELDVAHEELRVVEEELHTQADELNVMYGELERERQRYLSLFEFAPESYLVTDTGGVVLEANQRACELLNIHAQFVVGKPLALYVGEDERALMRNVLGLLVSNDEVLTFDLRIRPRHSQHSVWTKAIVRRSLGEARSAVELRWMLHPQRETDRQREQLEHELTQERRAREHAERALAQHNELLGFVAHELRNPLTSAAGWLEILHRPDNAEAVRERALDVLTRNLKMLARMVEELVDRTRNVEGQITIECQRTDMRTLLERVCDDARGQAQVKHQRFSCELPPDLGIVRCDPFRVQQAVGNVIGNALKFTPTEGAVQLTARVLDDVVEILVRDTGPGIAQEHLKSIFEPFIRLQAHSATAGLGLGLNIARKLVELHGGSIRAESEGPGSGATFHIRLPVGGPRE